MDKIDDYLSKKTEFLTLLEQDIDKNKIIHSQIEEKIKSLEKTRENIKSLHQQPEHIALIPLCKKLYVPGTLVHTGEYMVTKKAHPNSYSVLKTLEQTVKDLDEQILEQRGLFEKGSLAVSQLVDRKKLLLGEQDEDVIVEKLIVNDEEYHLAEEVAKMPNEIKSDKGVAVKVGQFFEIFEYEEEGR
ncbi:unnamed protein product [Ceutorhynchus assimilis]|uniref:Uncharacterized protein n=1 Tax=Ceutorhynchus assimilis TaxID=467358 RepID=A0A9N9QPD1_9CUCU|nr:unnamed protein product [Ceutorhynchus assimilis]